MGSLLWWMQKAYELSSSLTAKPTRVKGRLVYYAFDLCTAFDLRGASLIDRNA